MNDPTRNLIETPAELTGELKSAVIDLLYRLADDELVIGHRNSEWTGLGPILEADIAFSSIAQDEIGHALAYFRLLHEMGEAEPDKNAFLRAPEEYRCCALVVQSKKDWAFSLARQYLYDAAEQVRLTALVESRFRPLAILARKFAGEEKYHRMHGRTWVTHLARGTDESRSRIQAALDDAFRYAMSVFEPGKCERLLSESGIQPSESDLEARWRSLIVKELGDAGLQLNADGARYYGGRFGQHSKDLTELLEAMQKVFRLEPAAAW